MSVSKKIGNAVNERRKRYCQDLKTGTVHLKDGSVACDPNTGQVISLNKNEKAYRAGYCKAVGNLTCLAKNYVGLPANAKVPGDVQIRTTAFSRSTGQSLSKEDVMAAFEKSVSK